MQLDKNLLFSDDQDLSQVVAAYLSDFSVDLGVNGSAIGGGKSIKDVGRGFPVEVLCQVTETFVGATATMSVELIIADDGPLSSNVVSIAQAPGASVTVGIPVATLVAGYQFRIGGTVPPGINKRYIGLRYNIFTATTTAGTITAGLLLNKDTAMVTL